MESSVVLVYLVARGLYDRGTAMVAALIWATAAWVIFMSATYMNHLSTVAYTLAAWALVFTPRPARAPHLAFAGAALALAAATRPLDAVAAAVPVGLWIVHQRRPAAIAWIALGALPVGAAWAYLNWRMFGAPFTLRYSVIWGPQVTLGFHTDPWGDPYTPVIGLANMGVAIRRLHIYLFEWPIPALLPVVIWAFAARRTVGDLYVAAGAIGFPLLYLFYWHSGFYLGPRFYYGAAPMLVIATARAWCWAWQRARAAPARPVRWDVALAAAAAIVLVWGWAFIMPKWYDVYEEGLATMKLHPERDLEARGVQRALVLMPESWGSRMITEFWGLGIPPAIVEQAYRRVDSCDLYQYLVRVRREGTTPARITAGLEAMIADVTTESPRVESWSDPTLKLRPRRLPAECATELWHDQTGFTLYANHAWRNAVALDTGIVFARDLYERNDQLFARYAGWPPVALRPDA